MPERHVAKRPAFYANMPTRTTVFWRTFLPWQLVRFIVINLRMVRIIARSHKTQIRKAAPR
jgi:hypothetical protein